MAQAYGLRKGRGEGVIVAGISLFGGLVHPRHKGFEGNGPGDPGDRKKEQLYGPVGRQPRGRDGDDHDDIGKEPQKEREHAEEFPGTLVHCSRHFILSTASALAREVRSR